MEGLLVFLKFTTYTSSEEFDLNDLLLVCLVSKFRIKLSNYDVSFSILI